jgi:hypothetical protein
MLRSSRLILPVVAMTLVAATPARIADGWRFTWKFQVDETSGQNPYQQPSMSVQMIPGKLRMDFLGDSPQGKKGGYMLLDAEKGTMAMVSPQDKTVMLMEPGALGAMAGAVGSVVKMDVSDVKVDVEDQGAGEKILGRSTHKYRITRSYGMQVSVFGKKMKSTHHSVTEAWVSKEMLLDKSWELWTDNFARGASRLGGNAFKQLVEAERTVPKAVPLRQQMTNTDTDDKGKVTTTRMSWEMTELKKDNLPASAFEIPGDYQVMDMKQTMAETEKALEQAKTDCEKEHGKGAKECDPSQINLDSLVAAARTGVAEGLKEGVKEAAKEGAKDAIKKGILGRFKKPGGE